MAQSSQNGYGGVRLAATTVLKGSISSRALAHRTTHIFQFNHGLVNRTHRKQQALLFLVMKLGLRQPIPSPRAPGWVGLRAARKQPSGTSLGFLSRCQVTPKAITFTVPCSETNKVQVSYLPWFCLPIRAETIWSSGCQFFVGWEPRECLFGYQDKECRGCG